MLLEQPTPILQKIYRDGIFRKDPQDHCVYLTFDDGPIPEVTPWILETLDRYGVKATFFVVGDNVRKHPDIYRMLQEKGHTLGNHTFNHVRGMQMRTPDYIDNVEKCRALVDSQLFRPPHGVLRKWVYRYMVKDYKLVFYDVITRDYSNKMNGEKVFKNVRKYTRNGSIIVFHDSLKSKDKLFYALPKSIEWLQQQGYEFRTL